MINRNIISLLSVIAIVAIVFLLSLFPEYPLEQSVKSTEQASTTEARTTATGPAPSLSRSDSTSAITPRLQQQESVVASPFVSKTNSLASSAAGSVGKEDMSSSERRGSRASDVESRSLGVQFIDKKGNTVTVSVPEMFSRDDITISDGHYIDEPGPGVDELTDRFIKISMPKGNKTRYLTIPIAIRYSVLPTRVVGYDSREDELYLVPFSTDQPGIIVMTPDLVDGQFSFALVREHNQ